MVRPVVYHCHGATSVYGTAAHRRISQTHASRRLRPVTVSARLVPSHASYRGAPELVWATGRLMSPDRGFGTQTNNKDGQPIAHSANVNKACHATQAAKSRDLWQEMCHVVRYDSR